MGTNIKTMGKTSSTDEREQRLAAKLRENLRRRKSQAKARAVGQKEQAEDDVSKKPGKSERD